MVLRHVIWCTETLPPTVQFPGLIAWVTMRKRGADLSPFWWQFTGVVCFAMKWIQVSFLDKMHDKVSPPNINIHIKTLSTFKNTTRPVTIKNERKDLCCLSSTRP